MTTKKRKAPFTSTVKVEHLEPFDPLTDSQAKAKHHWEEGKHLVLSGSAGTGKTYLALRFALNEVLQKNTPYDKVVIIRSIVPTRDIGFLPGDEEEKKQAYISPYVSIAEEITGLKGAWNMLMNGKHVEFESTSFIRGMTYDHAIVVVDEMQNLNFHELDSVITRCGLNTRIIFSGDYYQSDFHRDKERSGILEFIEILKHMKDFEMVEFNWEDIIRSDLVRDYIMTKEILAKRKEDGK